MISVFVLFLLALWLLSSAIEVLGFFLVNVAGNTAQKGFLKAVREAIAAASNLHPEKTVVFLRNLVLTEKAWEIAELENKKGERFKTVIPLARRSLGEGGSEVVYPERCRSEESRFESKKKFSNQVPTIILDLHFGHAGIAKMLRWPPRLRQLILKLYKPFIKPILNNPIQRDYLARLTSVSWQSDHWHLERNYLVDTLEFL